MPNSPSRKRSRNGNQITKSAKRVRSANNAMTFRVNQKRYGSKHGRIPGGLAALRASLPPNNNNGSPLRGGARSRRSATRRAATRKGRRATRRH